MRRKGSVDVQKRDVGASKEKKRRLILSDSDSDSDEVLFSVEKVELESAENGGGLTAGEDEDLGSGTVMTEEVKQRDNVVAINKRVLRSDVKQEEGVSMENGDTQFPFERKKNVELSEIGVGLMPLDAEVHNDIGNSGIGKSRDVNGVELDEQKEKENAVDVKMRMSRSHCIKKVEDNGDEKEDIDVNAGVSEAGTEGALDSEFLFGRDSSKISNEKHIKEEEGLVGKESGVQIKKRILRSDIIKHEKVSDKEEEESSHSRLERKRSREPSDARISHGRIKHSSDTEVLLKKFKGDSSHSGKRITEGSSVKKYLNDSSRQGDDKGSAMENSKYLEEADNAGSESDGVRVKQKDLSSDRNNKEQDENIKCRERSGSRVLRLLKDSSVSPDRSLRRDSSITRKNNGVMKVQDKEGALRVMPNNKKVDELENFLLKRRQDEKPSVSGTHRNVPRGASKQPSIYVERKVHEKSNSRATKDKRHLKGRLQSPTRKSIFKELKREPNEKSTAGVSRKLKFSAESSPIKGKSSSGSKSPILSKQKADDCSKSAVKQNLRDQIKSILLNAGWTIDLRPRRFKNYLDSVYIPPDKHGSYWSITKAYAMYQKKLSNSGAENRKETGKVKKPSVINGNAEGSSSSLHIIPIESLSMLRRISVNKRRSKEEIEEALQHNKRKAKKNSNKMSPNKYGKMKVGEIRKKKKLYDSLVSDGHACASIAYEHFQTRKDRQKGCALLARGSNQETECEGEDYVPYAWKRTVLSWMIDVGAVPLNGKVKYMNSRKTKEKIEGWIKRDGIQCSCCSKIVPISKFELHAGSKLQQASDYIHVEGLGVSLLQCQLDAWKTQDVSERQEFYAIDVSGDDPNDDTCGICGDGGDLICCDSCPSTFHLSCLGFEMLPPGDWNCTNCSCRFCRVVSASDVHGNDRTLLSCSQCEQKYHQDCVPEVISVHAGADNSVTSFCEQSCRKVFKRLQKLVGTKNSMEGGFSWSLIRRFDEDSSDTLHTLAKRAECNAKIAVALAVMDECFLPITDQRSDINLLHNVVYNCGSNFSRLNYTGFYTFVLERGEEIISAASVRFHGTRLAEMPFIGTRNMYRRQGMARKLLNGIEIALRSLNVEKLVIPAISELRDTWTNVFGFKPLESLEEMEFRSINMLVFPGTGLLQKLLLGSGSATQKKLAVAATYDGSNQDKLFDFTHESPNVSSAPNLHNSDKHVSDNLVESGASDSPKSFDVPNQSEVYMPEEKSVEVDGNKNMNISPAAVSHNSPVAEVQSQPKSSMNAPCQLLCVGKENGNHELKISNSECTSDVKYNSQICGDFALHESGSDARTEAQTEVSEESDPASHVTSEDADGLRDLTAKVDSCATVGLTILNVSKDSISGQVKSDVHGASTGNEDVKQDASSIIVNASVVSNSYLSRTSFLSGANHESEGVHGVVSISCGTYEGQSPEQKVDLLKIPIGSENLPSATKSTRHCGNSCIEALHFSLSKTTDSCNGEDVPQGAKNKHQNSDYYEEILNGKGGDFSRESALERGNAELMIVCKSDNLS